MQIYGIFTEYPWKIMENMRKIIPFLSISFHNLLQDDPFSRSFSVVFSVISGEKWRISEKNGEYRRHLSVFFPLHYTFIPQPLDFLPQILNLTEYNKKSYLFYLVEHNFLLSLHQIAEELQTAVI